MLYFTYCNLFSYALATEVHQGQGIDSVTQSTSTIFNIYSSKGIGSLLLHLPQGEEAKLHFNYEKDKPFKAIEGLTIASISNGLDITEELISSGMVLINGGCLKIKNQGKPIKWDIRFIDYFRN